MREVQKGTTEEYRRIGLDVPDPDLLANAELYQLIQDKTLNNNNRLVTRENLPVDGPCAGDIQCVIARIAMQILCGIAALHEIDSGEQAEKKINIVHQDIKPENILLGKFGSRSSLAGVEEDLSAKIIDLGEAQAFGKEKDPEEVEGTPYYWAPETVLAHDFKAEGDIFAVGLILMELAAGRVNPVYDGCLLLTDGGYRSKVLAQNRKNPFRRNFQKSMDLSVLGQGIGSMDPGREQ